MKKILFILSLFISTALSAQNVHNNNVSRKVGTDSIYYNTNSINSFAGRDTLLGVKTIAQNSIAIDSAVQVGTIYDSSTWNNIDPGVFTKTGTVTVTSNKITMGTGTNAIQWVTSTGFDQETFQVDLQMTALTTNDSFPQIGWTSTNTSPIPPISLFMSYSKATNTVEMYAIISGVRGVTFSSAALTGGVAVNDNLSFIIDRDADANGTVTATVINNTTGNRVSVSTNINPFLQSNTTSGILRNTGAFSITGRGATTNTLTVNRIYYHSIAPKYPKAVVIGYSIDYGSWAGAFTSRYVNLIHAIMWGGASDGSQSGVHSMTALYTYMKPKNVFITLVGNDIFYGVSSGTWQANLTAIHDTLTAHGINVIFLDPSPRTATDMTPGKTWIEANYPSAFINTFTPFLGSGTTLNATYDGGDGVHLNAAGHALFASTIKASTLYQNMASFGYVRYYTKPDYINPASGALDSNAIPTFADIPRYSNVTVPGGSTTQVQRNNAGAFGGISGATSDGTDIFIPSLPGGSGSAGNLTLRSTTHATKGKIIFDATRGSYYSESIGNMFLGGTGASNFAYTAAYSDLTGGGAIFPGILLQNTNVSSPGGGQYNIAMASLQAGGTTVTGQFAANFGAGATVPFTVQGFVVGTRTNDPLIFFQNSNQIARVDATGFHPFTTASFDLGTSSLKWRDITTSRNASIGGNFTLATAGSSFNITEGSNGRVGQVALVAGTKAITITGLTTSSRAIVTLVIPNTTTNTVTYQAVCTANTLTIQANVAAGTINTADISTVNYFVIN